METLLDESRIREYFIVSQRASVLCMYTQIVHFSDRLFTYIIVKNYTTERGGHFDGQCWTEN